MGPRTCLSPDPVDLRRSASVWRVSPGVADAFTGPVVVSRGVYRLKTDRFVHLVSYSGA